MRIVDKMLLLLLVILLPAGVFLSSRYFNSDDNGGSTGASEDQIAKVEELIKNLSETGQKRIEEVPEKSLMQVTSVTLASRSGILNLSGVAPSGSLPIRLTWTEIKDEAVIAELGADDESGTVLLSNTTRTFMPRSDGSFLLRLPVAIEHGLLDITLEQGMDRKYLLYDLDVQKIVEEN